MAPRAERISSVCLVTAAEEAKRLSALLTAEMLRWPGVRLGRMFGLVSVYRDDVFFAWLPASRGFQTAHGVAIKRNPGAEATKDRAKWETLDVAGESDLRGVLNRLQQAYAKASR